MESESEFLFSDEKSESFPKWTKYDPNPGMILSGLVEIAKLQKILVKMGQI